MNLRRLFFRRLPARHPLGSEAGLLRLARNMALITLWFLAVHRLDTELFEF